MFDVGSKSALILFGSKPPPEFNALDFTFPISALRLLNLLSIVSSSMVTSASSPFGKCGNSGKTST